MPSCLVERFKFDGQAYHLLCRAVSNKKITLFKERIREREREREREGGGGDLLVKGTTFYVIL